MLANRPMIPQELDSPVFSGQPEVEESAFLRPVSFCAPLGGEDDAVAEAPTRSIKFFLKSVFERQREYLGTRRSLSPK